MAFIKVVHVNIDAQRSQSLYASDTEHHFLGYSLFAKPAVELPCNPSVLIARHIRVEKVKRCIAK